MASLWEPILAGALLVATALMAAMTAAAFLVWRWGRRKWRAFHAHAAVVGARSLWDATADGGFGHRTPRSSGDVDQEVHQWTPRQVRRELWRAVDQADAAVRTASRAGAPVASLPDLCRRLNDAAVGLDQVLRVETGSRAPDQVATQAAEVIRAASDVRRAAVASASDATGHQVRELVRDADHEIQCLDAGLASVQAALPPRPRR